jgi:pyridoxal phosphate enzyme (YggS family)
MVDSREAVRRNLGEVREKLASSALASGRRPEDILLMGVTKFQPLESIYAARDLGLSLFGENRVQEREEKNASWAGPGAEWHMIGHLQKNKARKALELFDCIQSVDDIGLALTLERIIKEEGDGGIHSNRRYPIMIEVNVSGEYSKQGVTPEKCFALIDDIAVKCSKVEIIGLMTIGPMTGDTGQIAASFGLLGKLREGAREKFGFAMPHLSMGMSGDYDLAIKEGSTIVRVGTAIFGLRHR